MRNHYDVLNLEKNCSAKDIKESFIKLSKKYHPDKNKSPEAHKKFVEVNEAYSVLGKSVSRVRYDEILSQTRVAYQRSTGARVRTQEYHHDDYYSPHYYAYPNRSKHNYEKTGNWNTAPKYRALLYCCLLMAVGTGIRFMVIWSEIRRKETRSQEISMVLKEVKEKSRKLGKEQAIIEMQNRFLKSKLDGKNRPEH